MTVLPSKRASCKAILHLCVCVCVYVYIYNMRPENIYGAPLSHRKVKMQTISVFSSMRMKEPFLIGIVINYYKFSKYWVNNSLYTKNVKWLHNSSWRCYSGTASILWNTSHSRHSLSSHKNSVRFLTSCKQNHC